MNIILSIVVYENGFWSTFFFLFYKVFYEKMLNNLLISVVAFEKKFRDKNRSKVEEVLSVGYIVRRRNSLTRCIITIFHCAELRFRRRKQRLIFLSKLRKKKNIFTIFHHLRRVKNQKSIHFCGYVADEFFFKLKRYVEEIRVTQ